MSRVIFLVISTVCLGSKLETGDDIRSIVLCLDFLPAGISSASCCQASVLSAVALEFPLITNDHALGQFLVSCLNSNRRLNLCQANEEFQTSAACYFINDTLNPANADGCIQMDGQSVRWCVGNKCEMASQRRCHLQEYWNVKHGPSYLVTIQIGSAVETRLQIAMSADSFDSDETETKANVTQCTEAATFDFCLENCGPISARSERFQCDKDKVLCLNTGFCNELPPNRRIYTRERYCPFQKVEIQCRTRLRALTKLVDQIYCLDFEGCNLPDPVFVPTLRPTEFSQFKCPLGLKLCADRQTCSFIRHQNLDDERDNVADLFNCTFEDNEIISKTSTCSKHSDCHWSAKCCSDGGMNRRCISYNRTAERAVGARENCPVTNLHIKTSEKCVNTTECKSGNVCCHGFCYREQKCSDGFLFCDVTEQCVDITNGSCGLSCPPPLGYCPGKISCVMKDTCRQGFNGGKAWIVLPSLTNGFTLEDVWRPLNYTPGNLHELLAVGGTSGVGTWETYDPATRRWESVRVGHQLTAQSLLRVIDTPSVGFAQLTVGHGDVQRWLMHFLLPEAEHQLQRTLSAGYSIPQGASQLIDINAIPHLSQRAVNDSDLERLWKVIESKASMLDFSSPVLKKIYQMKRNATRSAGWTLLPVSASRPEINFTIQHSIDHGASWVEMDPSQPAAFVDGKFLLRLSARTVSRIQLHLTQPMNRVDITVHVTPAECEIISLVDGDHLPVVKWNETNRGIRATDLARLFYRPCESTLVNLVVVYAANSSLGRWQCSPTDGGDWTDLIVDRNSSNPALSQVSLIGHLTRMGGSILSDALVLPASHRLRFVAHSNGRQWTHQEAMAGARIVFTASVRRPEEGAALRNISRFNSSQDQSVSLFFMEFADCSGHSSDQLKMPDSCGICGGDNSTCAECTATECGRCMDRVEISTRDCAFQCQPLNELNGSVCVARSSRIPWMPCNATEGQFLNKCGFCVTESDPLRGMNPCGTCSPDASCPGCGRLADGQCTRSHSRDDDSPVLMGWRRSKIDLVYGHRHTVSLRAAEIPKNPANPSCRLHLIDGPDRNHSRVDSCLSTHGTLWITIQVYITGSYSIACTWNASGTHLTGHLDVVDSTTLTAVADISPRRVAVAMNVGVNVTTSNKVNITGMQCVYQQVGHAIRAVAASGVYGNVVTCQLAVTYATRTQLALATGQFGTFSAIDQWRLELQVTAPAPRLISCVLSRSLDHVSISFDQNVEGPRRCSDLFEPTSLGLMGRDFGCTFSANRLTVWLGLNHLVCPGSRISFRSAAIRRQGSSAELASSFQGADITVQLTESIRIEPIVILGPNSICPDTIASYRVGRLDEIHSTNATLTWQLVKANKSVTIATGPQLNLLLNSSLVDAGYWNQLKLQVHWSLCGRYYSASSWFNIRISSALSVAITGPSRVYLDGHYIFIASVSTCRDDVGLLNYRWSVNGTGVASRLNVARIDLPRRLSPRSFYRLTCYVYDSRDLNLNGQAEINFYVDDRGIDARVVPSVQVVGSEGFTLDGTWSQDSAHVPGARLEFLWRCLRSDGGGCYVARRGPPRRLEQSIGLIDLQKPVLRIADLLPPGNYTFTLSLYKGLQYFAEANATVIVVAQDYPAIRVNYIENEFVAARVRCAVACIAHWSVEPETGTNYHLIDTESLNSRSVDKASEFAIAVKIPQFALPAEAEIRFKLKLSVQYLETLQLTAQTTVELDFHSGPIGGNFTAESIDSFDGLPSVAFRAQKWIDRPQCLPLTYRFGYRLTSTNIWLNSPTYENIVSIVVPFVRLQNVTPLATICNNKLVCVLIEGQSIQVGRNATDFSGILTKSSAAVDSGHHHEALSLIHSALISDSITWQNDTKNWITNAVIRPRLAHYRQIRSDDADRFIAIEAVQFCTLAFDVSMLSRDADLIEEIAKTSDGIPLMDLDHVILRWRLAEWLTSTMPRHEKKRITADLLKLATCYDSKVRSVQSETIRLSSQRILLHNDSPQLLPVDAIFQSLKFVDLSSLVADPASSGAVCLQMVEMNFLPSYQVINGRHWTRIGNVALIQAADLFSHSKLAPVSSIFNAIHLNSTGKLECLTWNLNSNQWEPSCVTNYPSVFMQSDDFIDCTCYGSEFQAIFVSYDIESQWPVRIQILNDFNATVGARREEFVNYLIGQLSGILNISVQEFDKVDIHLNMTLTLSIIPRHDKGPVHVLENLLANQMLQLFDLNGRQLIIPTQTIDGLLYYQGVGLTFWFVGIGVFSLLIGLVGFKVWARSANVVNPLTIPSPKSYLYPNMLFTELPVLKMNRSPNPLTISHKY